jgi:hypothetical protein
MVDRMEFRNSPATRHNDGPRPLEAARCSLCGIELPKGLMMPDGGRACADIMWYCKDTKSCTERWTARPDTSTGPRALEGAPKNRAPRDRAPAEAEQSQPAAGT